jgi:CheY-like chemotaxis protein
MLVTVETDLHGWRGGQVDDLLGLLKYSELGDSEMSWQESQSTTCGRSNARGSQKPEAKPILLVDSDPVDAMTVSRALTELETTRPLVHMPDSEEALLYLRSANGYKPCLILLDIDLPCSGSFDFLKTVKADEELNEIPVVMLAESDDPEDVFGSFQLGAVGYMVKPDDYVDFFETIRTIYIYWTLSESPVVGG